MYIDPTLLATMTGLIGALAAATWSYLMASKVAAPRAKRMIVDALTHEGPELVAVREHLIQPALDAQRAVAATQTAAGQAAIAAELERIVKANLGALSIDAGALAEAIGPQVSTHINMALKQAEAQQGKRIGAFLKDMGLDEQLGELEAGAREQAMAALPAQAQVLMEIMNTKIPKSATTSERVLMQAAKVTAAQLLQGGMANIMPGQASASAGTGYSPGL